MAVLGAAELKASYQAVPNVMRCCDLTTNMRKSGMASFTLHALSKFIWLAEKATCSPGLCTTTLMVHSDY
jgi:hypothetical protein